MAMLVLTSATQAEFISGSINFSTASGGGIVFQDSAGNVTPNIGAATGIQSWSLAEVEEGSGSFDTVIDGTAVFFSQPWVFNPSTSMTPLWTIAGPENFKFNMSSSTTVFQNGSFLGIQGTGTLTGTGFEDTAGTWLFTSQGAAAKNKFSWSSSAAANAVPDGSTSIVLLGGSLLGIFGLRRKFCKR